MFKFKKKNKDEFLVVLSPKELKAADIGAHPWTGIMNKVTKINLSSIYGAYNNSMVVPTNVIANAIEFLYENKIAFEIDMVNAGRNIYKGWFEIDMPINIHNYYEDYVKKGKKRFNTEKNKLNKRFKRDIKNNVKLGYENLTEIMQVLHGKFVLDKNDFAIRFFNEADRAYFLLLNNELYKVFDTKNSTKKHSEKLHKIRAFLSTKNVLKTTTKTVKKHGRYIFTFLPFMVRLPLLPFHLIATILSHTIHKALYKTLSRKSPVNSYYKDMV